MNDIGRAPPTRLTSILASPRARLAVILPYSVGSSDGVDGSRGDKGLTRMFPVAIGRAPSGWFGSEGAARHEVSGPSQRGRNVRYYTYTYCIIVATRAARKSS